VDRRLVSDGADTLPQAAVGSSLVAPLFVACLLGRVGILRADVQAETSDTQLSHTQLSSHTSSFIATPQGGIGP